MLLELCREAVVKVTSRRRQLDVMLREANVFHCRYEEIELQLSDMEHHNGVEGAGDQCSLHEDLNVRMCVFCAYLEE